MHLSQGRNFQPKGEKLQAPKVGTGWGVERSPVRLVGPELGEQGHSHRR